jgi:hypothetical protein
MSCCKKLNILKHKDDKKDEKEFWNKETQRKELS